MIKSITRIACLAIVSVFLSGLGVAQILPYPGPQTPTNMWVTIKHVGMGISLNVAPKNVLTDEATIDVVGSNGMTAGAQDVFGVGSLTSDEYKFMQTTIKEFGTYSGTDPCTGMLADHAPIQFLAPLPILGGPIPGEVQINYMVPHPVTGLEYGYLPMQPAKIGSSPAEFRLVFRTTDSVICASSSPPIRRVTTPAFGQPGGLAGYLDSNVDWQIVTERFGNTLDIYDRMDKDDTAGKPSGPIHHIVGEGLSTPSGIYADPSRGEIGVTNYGNDTVTYYDLNSLSFYTSGKSSRALSPLMITPASNSIRITEKNSLGTVIGTGDATIPAGTFTSGPILAPVVETALNSIPTTPGMLFGVTFDGSTQKFTITAIALAPGVASVTLNWTASTARDILGFNSSDSAPLMAGDNDTSDSPLVNNTGLSKPCGIAHDENTDEVIVGNKGNNTVTFYDPAASGNAAPTMIIKGANTGLNQPCGVTAVLDPNDPIQPDRPVIIVANSGNNTITVYDRNDVAGSPDGDVTPLRIISGPRSGLSIPTGVVADPTNNYEIGVTNNGANSITFYSLSLGYSPSQPEDEIARIKSEITPRRTIRGEVSALSGPWGIYLHPDPQNHENDQIGVANADGGLITIHKWKEDTVQLKEAPTLSISAQQQQLYPQFFYSGDLDSLGNPIIPTPPEPPVAFDGYNFYWKVTDDRIRQPGDVTNGLLVPPSNFSFVLTNGADASSLPFACPSLTPFIILEFSTNCPAPPLIQTPFPVKEGDYRVAAILFAELAIIRMHVTPNPVPESKMPRLVPTVSLYSTTSQTQSIHGISWKYVDQDGGDLPFPIIYSQQFRVNLTRPYNEVSPCYNQVAGNSPELIFSSPSLAPDKRSFEPILNSGVCEIDIKDVASINFTVTDALEERYQYTWNVVQ